MHDESNKEDDEKVMSEPEDFKIWASEKNKEFFYLPNIFKENFVQYNKNIFDTVLSEKRWLSLAIYTKKWIFWNLQRNHRKYACM